MYEVQVGARRRLRRRALAAILLAALSLAGCSSPARPAPASPPPASQPAATAPSEKQPTPANRVAAEVVRVIDGDTIEVKDLATGQRARVRLIGVDTPETVHPEKPVEPYGPEASNYTKRRLQGQRVELEFDVERKDRYGRLLAYVWLGDELFNATLVKEGYAQILTIPPNVKYVDLFRALQKEAREAKRGLWGLEDGAAANQAWSTAQAAQSANQAGSTAQAGQPAAGSAPSAPQKRGAFPPTNGQCVDGGQAYIKGNRNSMIYHVPGGQFYDKTYAEECFYTTADAEAAGYRASKR